MMKTKLIKTLLVAAIAIVAMGVTATEAEKTAPCANPAPASSKYQKLRGNIGPYAITMFLSYDGWKEGDFVGYYYYNSYPKNKFNLLLESMETLNLQGSMRVVLKEYTKSGKNSGVFRGQYEGRGDYYSGTFTNSKGQKYRFELQ